MIQIEMFPQELLDLQQELIVMDHAPLRLRLARMKDPDIYLRLAEISAYLGIVLDGTYTRDDILGLAKLLTKKLYESRTKILLPFH